MDGLTILETVRATEEIINKPLTITWCVVALIVFIFSIIGSFYFDNGFIGMLGLFFLICALDMLINPITEKKDLGYNKIIAYVDKQIITDEQIAAKYYILSKESEKDYLGNTTLISKTNWEKYAEGEIYTLREKQPEEEISTSENVHSEQPHNWSVIEKQNKEDTVEYVLQCSKCNQEKNIVRKK